MKSYSTFLTAAALGLFLASSTKAQSTAQEGLGKLKNNLSNSKSNLEDYRRNLKIVEGNVGEATKAKTLVDEQKSQALKVLNENSEKLQSFEKTETEINQLILTEQKEIQAEEQNIQELSKVIAQLKNNQALRNQNVSAYQEQMRQISKEKTDWKTRGDQIAKTTQNLESRSKALAQQESDWKTKQRGYVGEVNRWQKEVDRQQKLNENYNSLAEVKD